LPEVTEKKVHAALLRYRGKGQTNIQGTRIDISLDPEDIHTFDSPDILLWVSISLRLFGQDLRLRIPIPIEAEKGGIYGGALEDLTKFIERKKYALEVPMLVVAEAGYDSKGESGTLPVKFTLRQIPVRLLEG
jgi:hypothetical protein